MTTKRNAACPGQRLVKYGPTERKLESEDRRFEALPTVMRVPVESLFDEEIIWAINLDNLPEDTSGKPCRAYSFYPTNKYFGYEGHVLLFPDGEGVIVITHNFVGENQDSSLHKCPFMTEGSPLSFASYKNLRKRNIVYEFFDSYDDCHVCLRLYFWWMFQAEIMEMETDELIPLTNEIDLPTRQIEDYI